MIDTERSLQNIARLHAEIMRERAEGLHEAARAAKSRLVDREEAIARLRAQVKMLKASLNPASAVAASIPVPEKEVAMDSARFTTSSLPSRAPARSLREKR